jgi:hypothetical protein
MRFNKIKTLLRQKYRNSGFSYSLTQQWTGDRGALRLVASVSGWGLVCPRR